MLKPLHNNVVLEKEEVINMTASGIMLNASDKDQPNIAKVIAVGPGKYENDKLIPMALKVGDKVVYKEYSSTKIEIDDKEYLIILEDSVLAVVE